MNTESGESSLRRRESAETQYEFLAAFLLGPSRGQIEEKAVWPPRTAALEIGFSEVFGKVRFEMFILSDPIT